MAKRTLEDLQRQYSTNPISCKSADIKEKTAFGRVWDLVRVAMEKNKEKTDFLEENNGKIKKPWYNEGMK